jgi:hypothetical protein
MRESVGSSGGGLGEHLSKQRALLSAADGRN